MMLYILLLLGFLEFSLLPFEVVFLSFLLCVCYWKGVCCRKEEYDEVHFEVLHFGQDEEVPTCQVLQVELEVLYVQFHFPVKYKCCK